MRAAALLAALMFAASVLAGSSAGNASASRKCATYQDNICMFLSVKGHPEIAKQLSDSGVVKISAKQKLNVAIYIYQLVTKVKLSIAGAGGKMVETEKMDSVFIFQYFIDVPLGGAAYTKLHTRRPAVPDTWQQHTYKMSLKSKAA